MGVPTMSSQWPSVLAGFKQWNIPQLANDITRTRRALTAFKAKLVAIFRLIDGTFSGVEEWRVSEASVAAFRDTLFNEVLPRKLDALVLPTSAVQGLRLPDDLLAVITGNALSAQGAASAQGVAWAGAASTGGTDKGHWKEHPLVVDALDDVTSDDQEDSVGEDADNRTGSASAQPDVNTYMHALFNLQQKVAEKYSECRNYVAASNSPSQLPGAPHPWQPSRFGVAKSIVESPPTLLSTESGYSLNNAFFSPQDELKSKIELIALLGAGEESESQLYAVVSQANQMLKTVRRLAEKEANQLLVAAAVHKVITEALKDVTLWKNSRPDVRWIRACLCTSLSIPTRCYDYEYLRMLDRCKIINEQSPLTTLSDWLSDPQKERFRVRCEEDYNTILISRRVLTAASLMDKVKTGDFATKLATDDIPTITAQQLRDCIKLANTGSDRPAGRSIEYTAYTSGLEPREAPKAQIVNNIKTAIPTLPTKPKKKFFRCPFKRWKKQKNTLDDRIPGDLVHDDRTSEKHVRFASLNTSLIKG